jgi:hypothetical protein
VAPPSRRWLCAGVRGRRDDDDGDPGLARRAGVAVLLLGCPEYLLLRPATSGGDLVLLHAIGVHGLPLITLPALLLARTSLTERVRLRLVGTLAGAVIIGLAVLAVQAFGQHPLDALGPARITGLALLAAIYLAAAAGCGVAVLRGTTSPGGRTTLPWSTRGA